MTRTEFIIDEMSQFLTNNELRQGYKFRVAVGGTAPGLYAYGHAVERREYCDHTVGYTTIRDEAILLLVEAWDIVIDENQKANDSLWFQEIESNGTVSKLRRRVEDHLRKSPKDLEAIASKLAWDGAISLRDL